MVNKSMVSAHYDLSGSCVKAQLYVNALSAYLLGPVRENKGIKVSPGVEFQFALETMPKLYVFEAAVDPVHAAAIMKDIQIYVTWEEKKTLVATLSSAHLKVQLDIVMSKGMRLSHTSMRKDVYFNACEFKPRSLRKKSMRRFCWTNKEIWVTMVKPQEEFILNPEDDKKYHLLRVFAAENAIEEIDLHVKCGDKVEKIGVLPKEKTFYCNLEFEGTFSVSHSSKSADVIFFGYTVPNIFTVELPGPPKSDHFNKRRSPKKCDDPEYKAYVEKRVKGGIVRDKGHNLTTVSLVPSPLISCGRPNKRVKGPGPSSCNVEQF